eukprot:gene8553-9466_t
MNDLTKGCNTVEEMNEIFDAVRSDSPLTEIVISSLTTRRDSFGMPKKVKNLKRKLKDACDKRQIKMIDNSNLDAECLSAKNLHLNPRATLGILQRKYGINFSGIPSFIYGFGLLLKIRVALGSFSRLSRIILVWLNHDADILDAVYAEALHLAISKHYKDARAEEAALQKKETEPEFTAKEAQMSKISRDVKSVEANDDHCDMSFINALNTKFQTMQHSQQPTKKVDDKTAEQEEETSEVKQLALFGHKSTFDNIDLYVQPHELTEDHSNQGIHWISAMSPQSNHVFENRVSGNHLPSEPPELEKLLHMDNALCLPSAKDHQRSRKNYAAIIG